MAFHEQWFGAPKRRRLAEALAACLATSGDVIEVGSWEGRSTIVLANHFYPQPVIAVDHWLGDLGTPENGVAARAAARDVFTDFSENVAAETKGNVLVARMGWRDYPWERPIRFLFIDAEHSYREVADNIAVALPLMVPGGVIAGDDWTIPPVRRAASALLSDIVQHPGPGAAIWYSVIKSPQEG